MKKEKLFNRDLRKELNHFALPLVVNHSLDLVITSILAALIGHILQ